MINQQAAVTSQQSVIADVSHQVQERDIQSLKHGLNAADNNSHKDEFKKVAKEMESLFAYQLLKIMRESTGNLSDDKKENGYDTYMSLFDMEVSKLFADRGLGMQDAIVNWLERSPGVKGKDVYNKE